ncbi:hypothetical protein U0070_018145, partial [Myodes glareolus]
GSPVPSQEQPKRNKSDHYDIIKFPQPESGLKMTEDSNTLVLLWIHNPTDKTPNRSTTLNIPGSHKPGFPFTFGYEGLPPALEWSATPQGLAIP